jgi:hypothetical protein
VTFDVRTPPAIAVLTPVPGRSYAGRMTINFSATDDGAGVAAVEARLDGQLIASNSGRIMVDTATLAEGDHTLTVRAGDNAGHEVTNSYPFRVDRTGPSVSFVQPAAGSILRGVVQVIVEANDPAGISSISSGFNSAMTSPLTFNLDTMDLFGGPQALVAAAVDATVVDDGTAPGNRATGMVEVIVDDGTLVPCNDTTPFEIRTTSISGNTAGAGDDYQATCSPAGAEDVAYTFTATANIDRLQITLSGTNFQPALQVYRNYCGPTTLLGCASGNTVQVTDIRIGDQIVVVVDGASANQRGDYQLTIGGALAPGHSCDPAGPLGCTYGNCAAGPGGVYACPGADCGDGIDNDDDGLTDEDSAGCQDPPVLQCPIDGAIEVLARSTLTATEANPVLEREWSVITAPLGNTAEPTPANQRITTFYPLLSGPYRLRYTVLGDNYEFSSCETLKDARTLDGLRVEMIWNPDVPEQRHASDVDLHLIHPDGTAFSTAPLTCYYANRNPQWDQPGADDDPRLDVDDTNGRGPENINIRTPILGRPYRVGAYYFSDHGFGPARVYINVFCYGELLQAFGPVTLSNNDLWRIADVTLDGTSCRIDDLSGMNGAPNITPNGGHAPR